MIVRDGKKKKKQSKMGQVGMERNRCKPGSGPCRSCEGCQAREPAMASNREIPRPRAHQWRRFVPRPSRKGQIGRGLSVTCLLAEMELINAHLVMDPCAGGGGVLPWPRPWLKHSCM